MFHKKITLVCLFLWGQAERHEHRRYAKLENNRVKTISTALDICTHQSTRADLDGTPINLRPHRLLLSIRTEADKDKA